MNLRRLDLYLVFGAMECCSAISSPTDEYVDRLGHNTGLNDGSCFICSRIPSEMLEVSGRRCG